MSNLTVFKKNLSNLAECVRMVEKEDVPVFGDIIVGGHDGTCDIQEQIGVMQKQTVTYFRHTKAEMKRVSYSNRRIGNEYITGEKLEKPAGTILPMSRKQRNLLPGSI